MSARRTITVTLTDAQFRELVLAVDGRTMSLEDNVDAGFPEAARQLATLERAWDAISSAWHGKARRRGSARAVE